MSQDDFIGVATAPNAVLPADGERRLHARWAVTVCVREVKPEMHILRGTCIGAGGVFCPAAPPRERGEAVLLEIDSLDGRTMLVPATVAHTGRGPGGTGVAFRFETPQPDLDSNIRRHYELPEWED